MTEIEKQFEAARKAYPGEKRGFDFEWPDFKRWHKKKCPEYIPLLLPAIKRRMAYFDACDKVGEWHKQWQGFKTWAYNGHWTDTFSAIKTNTPTKRVCKYCGKPAVACYGRNWHCGGTECRAKAKK